MKSSQIRSQLCAALCGPVLESELLSEHTSFGIGGPAELFCSPKTETELSAALKTAHQNQLPTLVLGGGTNLLVNDNGVQGLTIKPQFHSFEINANALTVTVGASVPSALFVAQLVDAGYQGFEFAAGLPGTVGGAVAGNAGCFGSTFSEQLISATALDSTGNIHTITDTNWFEFAYRNSCVTAKQMILSQLCFAIKKGDKAAIIATSDQHIALRHKKHPSKGVKTAGSYFKNLPPQNTGEFRQAAGLFLDQVGAKNMSVGDAAVFEKHANIVINKGAAKAADILALAAQMAEKVHQKFGITLEPEVRFIG